MRVWQGGLLVATLLAAACGSRSGDASSMTPARTAAVEENVRAFAATVARDVTAGGPAAWRRHFEDTPAFFMASEGRLAFPNSQSATAGIQDLARSIKRIELHWGDDLRIDPLAPDLAMVAAPWREIQVSASGERVEQAGYFTGLAEYRNGRWQFRNAHWSVAAAPSAAR